MTPGRMVALAPRLGVGLVVALGTAMALIPVALIERRPTVAVVAAGVAAVALVALVAAGWVGPFALVIAALPLPAVIEGDGPRLTLVAPLTAIVVFGWFTNAVLTGRTLLARGVPVPTGAIVAFAFITATVFAQHPLLSARELINLGVLGLLFVAAVSVFQEAPDAMRTVTRILVAVGAGCGLLAVLEGVGIVPGAFPRSGSALYRAALGFGQPNALGLFLVVVFPFAVLETSRGMRISGRVAGGAAALLIFCGLLFTFSRGSWLSVLTGMTALVIVGQWRWVVRAWLMTVVVLVAVDIVSGGLLRDTIQRTIGDWVIEQRALLMVAGIAMFFAYPVLGVGPGGFAESLDRVGAQIPSLVDFKPTPHNAYVQLAAETGIVGLLACTAFVAVVLVRLVRSLRATGSAAMDAEHRRFAHAVLWSFASVLAAGMVIWPLAHGAAQAVVFIVAMACVVPSLAGDGS